MNLKYLVRDIVKGQTPLERLEDRLKREFEFDEWSVPSVYTLGLKQRKTNI